MPIFYQVEKWIYGFLNLMEIWIHFQKILTMQISFELNITEITLNCLSFETMNIVQNLGSFFFYLMAIFILMFVLIFANILGTKIQNDRFHKAVDYLNECIFYNTLLRVLIESYIILALSGFLHLKIVSSFTVHF